MAAKVTVTIKYSDNSRSLTESWKVADTHPSAQMINSCEVELLRKWLAMGNSERGIVYNTKVS